jgi:hypothetical protein
MAHTYTHLLIHALFSTKERQPAIDRQLAPQLYAYMAQIIKTLRADPILINGVSRSHFKTLYNGLILQ